jgi:hypothetical protein
MKCIKWFTSSYDAFLWGNINNDTLEYSRVKCYTTMVILCACRIISIRTELLQPWHFLLTLLRIDSKSTFSDDVKKCQQSPTFPPRMVSITLIALPYRMFSLCGTILNERERVKRGINWVSCKTRFLHKNLCTRHHQVLIWNRVVSSW